MEKDLESLQARLLAEIAQYGAGHWTVEKLFNVLAGEAAAQLKSPQPYEDVKNLQYIYDILKTHYDCFVQKDENKCLKIKHVDWSNVSWSSIISSLIRDIVALSNDGLMQNFANRLIECIENDLDAEPLLIEITHLRENYWFSFIQSALRSYDRVALVLGAAHVDTLANALQEFADVLNLPDILLINTTTYSTDASPQILISPTQGRRSTSNGGKRKAERVKKISKIPKKMKRTKKKKVLQNSA